MLEVHWLILLLIFLPVSFFSWLVGYVWGTTVVVWKYEHEPKRGGNDGTN